MTEPTASNAPAEQRDESGRFLAGNTQSLKHGARSARTGVELAPKLAAILLEKERAVLADLGGPENISAAKREIVTRFIQASAIADSLAQDFLTHGVMTGKGRTRRSVSTYLQTLDRLHRLAAAIGLERVSKPVTVRDFVQGTSA